MQQWTHKIYGSSSVFLIIPGSILPMHTNFTIIGAWQTIMQIKYAN